MNASSMFVSAIRDRAQKLAQSCALFPLWADSFKLDVRLRRALEKLDAENPDVKPLIIAFLGGTGVGKSHLFNALLGQPNASQVSPAIRPCTSKPKMAFSRHDKPLLQSYMDLGLVDVIDAQLDGVVLVDCPDIDSIDQANREKTRQILGLADIVVFVTDPAKRANFVIHSEVKDWSERKRWYFVMTKLDQHQNDGIAIRGDFVKRINELGFEVDAKTSFFVSCLEPGGVEFLELRQTLLGARSREQRALLPLDSFLGHMQHALEPALGDYFKSQAEQLKSTEVRLEARLQEAYLNALAQSDCAEALKTLLREQVWQQSPERVGFLMSLPLWLRNRLASLGVSWSIGQILTGKASLLGVAGIGLSSVMSLLRGQLPYKKVAGALGVEFRTKVESIVADSKRTLEDMKIPFAEDAPKELAEEHRPDSKGWGLVGLGAALEAVARQVTRRQPEDEILEQLRGDIERLGQKIALAEFGFTVSIMTNLLPTVAVGDILYRTFMSWYSHDYLPWNFYGMAAMVFLGSLIPGYLVISRKIWRSSTLPDMRELVAQVNEPGATELIRIARKRVENLAHEFDLLQRQVAETRNTLASELDNPSFGERIRHSPKK